VRWCTLMSSSKNLFGFWVQMERDLPYSIEKVLIDSDRSTFYHFVPFCTTFQPHELFFYCFYTMRRHHYGKLKVCIAPRAVGKGQKALGKGDCREPLLSKGTHKKWAGKWPLVMGLLSGKRLSCVKFCVGKIAITKSSK
jgi:hypothetical protein